MWGIWRERFDYFGQSIGGDWATDQDDDEVVFPTEREARRVAGIWNSTSGGNVVYAPRRFF